MKKKILIFGLISLVLLAGVSAVLFNTKDELLTYFRTYKTDRERDVANALSSIKYTTDKECVIDYDTEEIYCMVCFEYDYTINEEIMTNDDCLTLNEDSTIAEDDAIIKTYVDANVRVYYPKEEIKYKKASMKDRVISI